MGWLRFDDQIGDHPKVLALGDLEALCGWLNVKVIAWSNRHAADGIIPKVQARRLAESFLGRLRLDGQKITAEQLFDALCAVPAGCRNPLWYDEGAAFRVHDILDYQPSRAQALEKRERDARRKAAGRDAQRRPDGPSPVRADSARTPDGVQPDSVWRPTVPSPTVPSPTVPSRPVPFRIENVNVRSQPGPDGPDDLAVAALVLELVEDLDDERSRGFFEQVARSLPHELVRQAASYARHLRAAGELRKSPGAAFTFELERLCTARGLPAFWGAGGAKRHGLRVVEPDAEEARRIELRRQGERLVGGGT